jgi:aspartate aminotransferase
MVEGGSELDELRARISETTLELIRLVGHRNRLAKRIGKLKNEVSLPVEDERVEDSLIQEVLQEADRVGVSRSAALKILRTLLFESKRLQSDQVNASSESPMASFERAVRLQREGKKLIRLDVGEPDFKPPKAVLQGCAEALFSFKTHYTLTRGIPELLSALRDYLRKRLGYRAEEDQLIVTSGGRFAVYASLASVVREGESAIVLEPAWPAYVQCLKFIGARPVVVRATLEDSWQPSVERVEAAVKADTRAIVLCNPNNPTGKILDEAVFRGLVDVANDYDLTVISDETYADYAYKDCPSILNEKARSFVFVNSFSKTWAMTGFRIGYAVSSPEITTRMLDLASLMLTSVPEFVQYGAIKALETSKEAEQNVIEMKRRIDFACELLDRITTLKYYKPDGAMYIFPEVDDDDFAAGDFTSKLLEEKGVSVTPGTAFGHFPKNFRISLCQPLEVLREGIVKIGEMLD